MRKLIIIQVLIIILMIAACDNKEQTQIESIEGGEQMGAWDISKSPLNGLPLQDNPYLYDDSLDTAIEYVYATILPSIGEDGIPITFTDLNKIVAFDTEAPVLDIYFQEGDEKGPYSNMIFDAVQSNATITIRGHSTRKAVQKSYKIKLSDKTGLWLGQKTLNLNKHAYDPTRITNKIAFDIFEELPDMTSMQLKFVKLYVRDTSSGQNGEFIDFGYYTHIEQPNKSFLNAHELDKSGSLYKAEDFEFLYDELRLKHEDDPDYSEALFEEVLEKKEGKSNESLIKMIQDVNDYTLSIDDVMSTYFNRDNYFTWMAANILIGNYDTISQNFLLYSPENSQTWYFLPWDYDGALGNDLISSKIEENRYVGVRQHGIGHYWRTSLAKRLFKHVENVDALSEKIELVYQYTNREKMEEVIDRYRDYSYTAITSMPDIKYIYAPIDYIENKLDEMPSIPEKNRAAYYAALESPMPGYMGDVMLSEGGQYQFFWDISYDLQGDYIYYKVEISDEPYFTDAFIVEEDIVTTKVLYDLAQYGLSGTCYWRLTIYDEHGNIQYPFDVYEDLDGIYHQGVRDFVIN